MVQEWEVGALRSCIWRFELQINQLALPPHMSFERKYVFVFDEKPKGSCHTTRASSFSTNDHEISNCGERFAAREGETWHKTRSN
jgi:hypothetical protein